METTWFIIVSLMLATYVVLDGFDFGAGILHLFIAKTDLERRSILAAIGPLWDGNEVWLLAGGGILFFAFPRAYSAGFSGFYLPLMMVLWLLIMRGISIEFRSLEKSPLWRSFWDGTFFISSALMAIVLGAALGNVIRGVPVESSGFFSGPLFTNFMPGAHPGVLDLYTVLVGLFTLAILAMHGALFLRMKLSGEVRDRAQKAALILWVAAFVLGLGATAATEFVRPELFQQLGGRPVFWVLIAAVVISFTGIPWAVKRFGDGGPFLFSCAFIASMLAATAAGLYPILLRSSIDPAFNLNIENASAGGIGLQVGIYWWIIAIVIAIGYFIYLFRTFKGKVDMEAEHGH
jgi:cytochrome d ubiquinol oxidase subunit II